MFEATSSNTVAPDAVGNPISEDFPATTAPTVSIEIGTKESKHVWYSRALVILVLCVVAATTSTLVYKYSDDVEQDSFHEYFEDVTNKVKSEFLGGASRRISALEGMAEHITSHVNSNPEIQWPNVVLPDFERTSRRTMDLSDVLSIAWLPIVTKEERASWEEFSVNNQGWLREGLDLQGIPEEDYDEEWVGIIQAWCGEKDENLSIPTHIYRISTEGAAEEAGDGPFAPFWQFGPAIPAPCIVNYNSFSHPTRELALQSAIENRKSLVTNSWDYRDVADESTIGKKATMNLFLQHGGNVEQYDAGPVADIYVPVFKDFDKEDVGGALTAYVYWEVYFENILSRQEEGIFVVLENTCNQTFTYRLDGSTATYIGQGELIDHDYRSYGSATKFGSFIGFEGDIGNLTDAQCLYRVVVYPSRDFEDAYTSKDPVRFAVALAAAFLFTSVVFLLYDYLVERRQKLVMAKAINSTAVVDSLFPAPVRERLLELERARWEEGKKNAQSVRFADITSIEDDEEEGDIGGPNAIADLYPDCTISFCDMVGFTEWASSREPRDVFRLLETMYKAFDRTAARLGVFKVETIGDCYVAATGLPIPQEDHAVIMAKFARECVANVAKVGKRLSDQLGEDTADLTVRVGMHSGPVTAGVLRGTKARFQLFGDTVNTAARMESTGEPTRVQISSWTADLLIRAGHEEWVSEREEHVEVKGKGLMKTFWLTPSKMEQSSVVSSSELS